MPDLLSPSPGAPDGFPFPEKIAREKAGLSEEDMRAFRNSTLKRDVDFVYHKKAVFLSAAALEKIAPGLLTPTAEKAQDGAIAPQPAPIADEPVKLLVVRANLANKHLLLCCAVGDDADRPRATVRVRVRSTEGFKARQGIEARLVPGYSDFYDLVSKYPRKKEQL